MHILTGDMFRKQNTRKKARNKSNQTGIYIKYKKIIILQMSTSEAPTDSTSAQSIGVSATSDAATIRGRVDAVVSSTSRPSLQSQASAVPPRIQKELAMLARDPGPGISAWPATPGATHELLGQIVGPEESPYRGGTFAVSITLPQR
jgi:hypothetical protein